MFGLTTMGQRRPSAAASACSGRWMTRAFGYGDAELVHQHELAGLGELRAERLEAVEDLYAAGLEVLQKAQRVEDLVAMIAVPGRRAHAVEDEGVLLFGMVRRVVEMVGREKLYVRRAAAVQLGKQRLEPVRLLVIDGDGKCDGHG